MNPEILTRLMEAVHDKRKYVLRDTKALPKHIKEEVEAQINAFRAGDMRIRNADLGSYFQAANCHDKWWVATTCEGVELIKGEVPKTRVSIIEDLVISSSSRKEET